MEATFRRNKLAAWYFIAALIMGLILVGSALADDGSGLLGLDSALALGCLAVMMRVWFVRIVVEPCGVLLVNWFGTRRIPWEAIVRIDPPEPYGWFVNGILFTTRDGKVHTATAFSPGPLDPESVTAGVVAELRKFHARYETATA